MSDFSLQGMYKVICSDIDGTLLDVNRYISDETRRVFDRLSRETLVVLASSRMPSAMHYLQHALGFPEGPLVAYNGALVLDARRSVIDSLTIPGQIFQMLQEEGFERHCNLSLYSRDSWFTAKEDEWTLREIHNTRVKPILKSYQESLDAVAEHGVHKLMCMGEESVIDQISSLLEEKSTQLNLYRSKPTYLEVIGSGTDKARGLQQLFELRHQEFQASDVAAFGDNYNDIELLSYAGWGVAVENAREEVKSVANRISAGNKEHGVAIELERLIAEGKLMTKSSIS